MKKVCLYVVLALMVVTGLAQSTNVSTAFHGSVKKADTYFDHLAYRNALHIYLHAFEKDPKNYHIRERIAECYFRLHDPVNAEKWYRELVHEPDIHAQAKFEFAEILAMNGKYQESKYWFGEYLKAKPNDISAKEKLAFLEKIHWFQEDSLRFVLMPAEFNTSHSEYGAHYFHEGIVFASSRDSDPLIKHKPFDGVHEDESLLNLYYVDRKLTGEWGRVRHFHSQHIKTIFHEGPMAFFDNDKQGVFTRTNMKNGRPVYDANGRANLSIYFAEVDLLGSLKNIRPFEHNNVGYSTAHPTLSKDGSVMYFSSTSPQGYGGSDIYVSRRLNGRWTEPENLGPVINTPGDESFPFLANDSTLYFSSNGHGTLGGLDILVSYKRKGQFTKAQNFGGPLNTRYDDFGLVCDEIGRVGFMASNRPGGKGLDDIYFFIANYYFVSGQVRELGTKTNLGDTHIYVYDEHGKQVDSVKSDADGSFRLYLPFDRDFSISASKEGYETLDDHFFSTKGKPFGVDSLYLPLWKHSLFAKGRVISNETEKILPGATVILKNKTDNRSDTVTVNEKGEYVFLVRPEKKYSIEASKDGFISKGFELNTAGMSKGELLNDIVLEEIFLNKEVVLFDFDKADLTPQSQKQLDNIVKALSRMPKATVSIGSHADSRGTKSYNQDLSQRRADAAVNYLVSKGIKRSRIESKAFGEELLLNQCSDGVECPEQLHSKNRRAEIKVQRQPIN